MRDTRICVAGAAGRMGSAVLREASPMGLTISAGLERDGHENVGGTLSAAGICDSDAMIYGTSSMDKALEDADVLISFTSPDSEIANIPEIVRMGKRIVMGTTGFSAEQRSEIDSVISGKVPAVISPNFSIGVNMLFGLIEHLKAFPKGYDVSIFEVHHTGKADSPSGTAKKLAEIVSGAKGYDNIVHGREGTSKRIGKELEVLSARAGGVPGIHDVIVAGPHEILRMEHSAFSRSAFAHGALHAAEWLMEKDEPRIYTMMDVLEL
jgi:4-hydroxy-tetrahydrodipicolinate reductase